MRNRLFVMPPIMLAIALMGISAVASADTLLVDRAKQKPAAALPLRGDSMSQVEGRYGAPQEKLDPRGGQKRQWPTIHRWVYPAFTVYFEKSRVIDVVANQADANEIGPKPLCCESLARARTSMCGD
ncbi:hypothetical protein [Xanthomonas hortorum]|nr:hypothetical protein [Xanthomonas hortorum]ETC87997.1 hypothetical protein XHC_2517 [Xanthomonas hortorum pv. carotae str. M081]